MEKHWELYHGSPRIVEHPYPGGGRVHNDYGPGFYCTENLALALEWARPEFRPGFAIKYYLEYEGLSVLDLNSKPYHILNWLAILLENRVFFMQTGIQKRACDYVLSHFLPDYADYDVIKGWRADDSYFKYARYFLDNSLSLEQLQRAMRLGNLGEQVVLKSEKAFSRLFYLTAVSSPDRYAAARAARDEEARKKFQKIATETKAEDGIFVMDMIRQNWTNDDARLQ